MPGTARNLCLLLGVGLLLAAWSGPARADEVEIYRPRFRLAAELAPIARDLLGTDGTVAADPGTGTLLLRGRPRAVERTLAALRELDVRPASYRVHSGLTRASELRAAGLEVGGWIDAGGIRVGRLQTPGPEGLTLRAYGESRSGSQGFAGQVLVMDGRSADLWTGTLHPARVGTVTRSGERLRRDETTALVPIQSGFRVSPRSLPDGRIEVRITALLEQPARLPAAPANLPMLVPGAGSAGPRGVSTTGLPGAIVSSGARTQIAVRPGEWVVVASGGSAGDGSSVDPFGSLDGQTGSSDSLFLLRVDVAD